ncbi:MYND-type zinc finger-containing chromatin reader Zmynd8-like [Sitodiplosis mosellana]|uniref:MYND-type zinc finger-containing chromatin reader Zmynd8-like n=1 Tax=Sitodiplosis mosellana TaxID=263140 RepID=UPI002443C155|nr:MYND-type zinc finger-containing chromatin reader Zmynd8-like [Sitodiplosis mosellana]
MTSTEKVHDAFCWHCHTAGTTLKCSSCIRSFHAKCKTQNETDATKDESWICSVCTRIQMDRNMVDIQEERETLPILINRVWNVKKFTLLNRLKKSDSIVNPIDLTKIKAKAHSYSSLYELYTYVQWMVHNCVILYPEIHAKAAAAKNLLKLIAEEMALIKQCTECYTHVTKHPNCWFSMVCSKPHILVWAKVKGSIYLPAKVMSVSEKMVTVRFFDDYTHANISANKCYLYSEINPKAKQYKLSSYHDALNKARSYIENIRKKYGTFQYAQAKTPFVPKALKQHIEQMIPGINGHHDKESQIVEVERETTKETNGVDVKGNSITVDTGEKDVGVGQSNESSHQSIIRKELSNVLRESNSSKRNHVSNEVNDEPSSKRVRFCDEYGDDLCQVQVFEPAEYELEAEEIGVLANGTEETEKTEETEIEQTETEDISSESMALPESNQAEISNIPEEPLDYSQNAEAAHIAEADENAQYIDTLENSQNVETPQNQQRVESGDEYVDIEDLSALEQRAHNTLIQNMKGIQGDLLNSIRMSQLRSKALNGLLMRTKDAHAKEVAALQARLERSKEALSECDQIRNGHLKEVALLKESHDQAKLEIQVMSDEIRVKNNEIKELKKQLVEMERSIEGIYEENANSEKQCNQKYLEIIEKMRKESDRKLSERLRCKGCDKELAFCGPLCAKIWNALQNPKPRGD